MTEFKERRSSARLVDVIPASIRHPGFEGGCRVLNLSANGLLCAVETPIPPMTKVELVLDVPPTGSQMKGREVTVRGVVVRNETVGEEERVAIFFTDISKASKAHLEKYISQKISE